MTTIIENIERAQLRDGLPDFEPGDRVRVHFQVVEGTRRRTQVFEGVVIRRQGSGARETFTVRKQSFGVGVERTFPLHSPKIEKLEVAARGDVRRAKLYYLRDRVGKAARVTERRWGVEDDVSPAGAAAPGVGDEPVTEAETEASTESEASADAAAPVESAPAEPEKSAEAEQPPAEEGEAGGDGSDEPQVVEDAQPDGDAQAEAGESQAEAAEDSAKADESND